MTMPAPEDSNRYWRWWYLLVLLVFAAELVFFYWLTRHF